MSGFERVCPDNAVLTIGFDEISEIGNAVDEEITRGISSWFDGLGALNGKERKLSPCVPSWEELGKDFHGRFKALESNSSNVVSTEISTTTKITRNLDGSVYKETVTTEKLPDGTTNTTRTVDTTPADDPYQSRTERTVTTSPAKDTAMRWGDSVRDECRMEDTKEVKNGMESAAAGKTKEASRPSDSTWWFWSRK